jgi:AraC-like DNA-binding protein
MNATKYARISLILYNILESYRIDPKPLFLEMGVNPELMKQSGMRYKLNNIKKLWQKASEVIDDPCFGLKAAELWHPSNFSALGYAMLASHSIRTALERMDRYYRVISDEKIMELNDTEDGLTLTLVFSNSLHDIPDRNIALLAVILSICRINYAEKLAPVSVTFTLPEPSCSAKFFEFFKCPVYFEASTNSLTLSLKSVDEFLSSSNPKLADLNDQVMIEYLAELDQDNLAQRVKATILDQLPSGNVTDESVSRDLYMSARKLQRQLESAGTTFYTLLNETRVDLAKKFLRDQGTSMTEIAYLLGFSENSAFSRAFKRWMGVSPSQYRKSA